MNICRVAELPAGFKMLTRHRIIRTAVMNGKDKRMSDPEDARL
jgi:hypothetical protein